MYILKYFLRDATLGKSRSGSNNVDEDGTDMRSRLNSLRATYDRTLQQTRDKYEQV